MRRLVLFFTLVWGIFFLPPHNAFASGARAQRIISLAPALTEILFGLGLEDNIIGVTTLCNYPPQASQKDKIGTFSQPNIEKILMLKPDIVFATGLEQAPYVEKMRNLGLQVYVSDPATMEELFASIEAIGALTYREEEATMMIQRMRMEIDNVQQRVQKVPQGQRPRVFIEVWNNPLLTAGRNSFVDEMISLAGGVNIAHDVLKPYISFSPEEVIKRNPECIILGYMNGEPTEGLIEDRLGWENVEAVKNKRIYGDISSDLLLRPGPRLIEGLKAIHQRLYPDDF
jgi:iron complex transport system substrate-binding protein